VRIIVTLQAIREFLVQAFFVRQLVTIDTTDDAAMIAGVTIDAVHTTVCGFLRRQQTNLVGVAGTTVVGRHDRFKNYPGRRMRCAVTIQTIRVFLPRAMRFMAFSTLQCFAMLRVAADAILLGMLARRCNKGLQHTGMTAAASWFRVDRLGQVPIQSVMRQVALLAVTNGKVAVVARLVTAFTARNDIFTERRMRAMTTDAGLLAVLATTLFQQCGGLFMTGRADRARLGWAGLDHVRQVRRMAFKAIAVRHIRNMWFVAFQALLRRTVLADMTFAAIERRMFVRILVEQPFLIIVTGQANRLNLAQFTHIHFQRLMRIMTAGAVFQGIVPPCRPGVTTVTAFADDLAVRLVLGMAGSTTCQLLRVSAPFRVQHRGLVLVAGGAELLRDDGIFLQSDILRLMRRVAEHAVFPLHRFFMAIMAVETDPRNSVVAVAAGTILLTVPTRQLGKILLDLFMTADANRSVWLVVFQGQYLGLVRRVAALAIANGVMRMISRPVADKTGARDASPFLRMFSMAAGTGRLRMLLMTGSAFDCIPVRAPFFGNLRGDISVTGGTLL